MKIGKIPTKLLDEVIISPSKSGVKRSEILLSPNIGEDCAAIDFGGEICAVSTDPITGTSDNIGKLAVNVNINDISSCGAEPIGIMVTLLLPPECDEAELKKIVKDIYESASQEGIAVLGGHTEITDAVLRPVISCTAIGKTKNRRIISSGGAKVGDLVIMTKYAGMEGTVILAGLDKLKGKIDSDLINRAKSLKNQLSVVKEGQIAAELGVMCMHDVTEGGIFGACYEIAYCSKTGIEIEADKIPVLDETKAICKFLNINPYRLISSGCMLISCPNSNSEKIINELEKNGIKASVIGRITDGGKYIIENNKRIPLNEPESDELYKA